MRRCKGLILYVACGAILLSTYYALPLSRDDLLHGLRLVEAQVQANFAGTATLLFFVSAILAYFAFPSMPLIYIAAGYCLNSLVGGVIILAGTASGGLGAFLLYRRHIPGRLRLPAKQHSPSKTWLALFGLRLSPVVPAPLVNFFAAYCNVSILHFVTTTLVGSAPLVFFYETVGQEGHDYLIGKQVHWWQFSGYLVILACSTLLSALGPWRSFLQTIRRLKDEIFTSMGRSAEYNWTRPEATGRTSK